MTTSTRTMTQTRILRTKRGNNEGTISKRSDGRWMARISLEGGRRKAFYGQTRSEVAQRMQEALSQVRQGFPMLDERQTVGDYMEAWYESIRPQLRGSSLRRYGDLVRLHVVPSLGKVPLARLTAQHVQLFYARKLREGLSSSTVHHIHGMFHRALEDALRMGLVQRNVTEMVRAPRRTSREMMTLSEAQARDFLKLVQGHRFEALFVLALTTGMREGELLGLRWQDIDFDRRVLHVRMNVQETEGPYVLAETKTSYSRRNISLTKEAVDVLRQHRTKQNDERSAMGAHWNGTLDLVFPNAWGGINIPDNFVRRFFKPLLAKAGLSPEMRFHDLRHTAATLLLSSGVHPKVVSEMLGHADISITLRVYAHVTPNMQQAAVSYMSRLFEEVAEA